MPEGPEIHLAARLVNRVAAGHSFTGRVVKSAVSTKNPEVQFEAASYRVVAEARGKEMKMVLEDQAKVVPRTEIHFRFGMSGCFQLTPASQLPKHAHLQFALATSPAQVLSFVDYRRFGRWEVGGAWGRDRGPDPVTEYQAFRANVLTNLEHREFAKPVCEVLLNQTFFNGIGNYLRAEVLYRAGVQPFAPAREVLAPLVEEAAPGHPDLLHLCSQLFQEVLDLQQGKVYETKFGVKKEAGDKEVKEEVSHSEDDQTFGSWLRCYYKEGMSNLKDGHGRTIWFQGEPGSLVRRGARPTKASTATKKSVKNKRYQVPQSGGQLAKEEIKEEVKDEVDEAKVEVKQELKVEDLKEEVKKEVKTKSKANRTKTTAGSKSTKTEEVKVVTDAEKPTKARKGKLQTKAETTDVPVKRSRKSRDQ